MGSTKQERLLELFFRGLQGENLSVHRLADEYGVSTKSVSRDISDLKAFLADHRDLAGSTELIYSNPNRCYQLRMDSFLTSKELLALIKVIIGSRAFSKVELLNLTDKLRQLTTPEDRDKLAELIRRELYHYTEVKHDCSSVQVMLWMVANCITERHEITIEYTRTDREIVSHRLRPASVMFADCYFYLIAFPVEGNLEKPLYFRVDRIKRIITHRQRFPADKGQFDEGLLRQRSLFMWPGKLQTIRFEFTGPSVQAVLDKLPTARILERSNGKYTVEAEVYGDGIKMWLLSQGRWVKVIAPEEFVETMRAEVESLFHYYNGG